MTLRPTYSFYLAAQKVASALGVGCPIVLKPASRAPIGVLIIGEVLAETGLPAGAFSILPCRRDGADLFTIDDRPVEKQGRTEERSDDVLASVIFGEFWIAGAALRLIRPTLSLLQQAAIWTVCECRSS